MSRVVRALALVALTAGSLSAQIKQKGFAATARIGAISPEKSASLNTGGVIGLDTEYSFTRFFGVGVNVDVGRVNTHGEDFVGRFRYGNAAVGGGDTVFYQYLSQPVSLVNLGGYATIRAPLGRLTPFALAGVGSYSMFLDPQVAGKAERKVEMSYLFGGGAFLRISENTGIQFDYRALQMQKYDRTFLDPSKGKSPNTVFPEDFPSVPPAKNTALNSVFSLGFRYIPGGGN